MGFIAVPKDPAANRVWRMNALRKGGTDPVAAKRLKEQCAEDILFWANTFLFTMDPRRRPSVIPFTTYPFQDEAILRICADIEDGRDVGVEKSRDMGASWINLVVLGWYWQFKPMSQFLVVSRNEDYVDGDADSLMWKIDYLLEHQPGWLKPAAVKRTSLRIVNLDNSSAIDGESTTGEVGRGGRRTAILMDEFAAFETKAGYNAMASTQSATNCRIFNSTPKGSSNAFYDVIHKSAADIISLHWSKHPRKNSGLYTSKRNENTGRMEAKLLDSWTGVVTVRAKGDAKSRKVRYPEDYPFVLDGKLRSPWYDLECSRAVTQMEISQELDIDYLGSDYQFFDAAAVEKYKELYCREPSSVGNFEIDWSGCSVRRFTPDGKGLFSVWTTMDAGGRPAFGRKFVMGVDVAAGTGASNSTIAVYERGTNEKVAEYANPNILPDEFGKLCVAVARFFNNALVVPDRSGPTGEVLVKRMRSEGYEGMLYRRRNTKKVGAPVTDEPGVWLNPQLRTSVLHEYRSAVQENQIVNRSARAMDECLRFICKMDGTIEHSAAANAKDPSGARANHGDMVIADALASMALAEGEGASAPSEPDTPENTMAWRMEQARNQRAAADADELGEEW